MSTWWYHPQAKPRSFSSQHFIPTFVYASNMQYIHPIILLIHPLPIPSPDLIQMSYRSFHLKYKREIPFHPMGGPEPTRTEPTDLSAFSYLASSSKLIIFDIFFAFDLSTRPECYQHWTNTPLIPSAISIGWNLSSDLSRTNIVVWHDWSPELTNMLYYPYP